MKKFITLILLLASLFLITACKKESKPKYLKGEEIFAQEGTYFVVFVRDDCSDCENVKPLIKNYLELLEKEEKKFENHSQVYIVNLSDKENEQIFRAYSESRLELGEGQGPAKNFFVDGVEVWSDLYIAEVSSMISIGTTRDGKTKANFEAAGYTELFNRLTEHLGLEE